MPSKLTLSVTDHLLQAAFRYISTRDRESLHQLLQVEPGVARARCPREGRGAIHAAAESGSVDLLNDLLAAGADSNMAEGTPLDDAEGGSYEPGYSPLHYAVRADSRESVSLLLSHGGNPNAVTCWFHSPLHEAESVEMVEVLLKAGSDSNIISYARFFDEETLGWHFESTKLHAAASRDDADLIRMLLDHGAKVDRCESLTSRTALHYAAALGCSAAVQVLLERGADVNAVASWTERKTKFIYSPLHYAAEQGHVEVVGLLLAGGADTRLVGGQLGRTAHDLAEECGHARVAELLSKL